METEVVAIVEAIVADPRTVEDTEAEDPTREVKQLFANTVKFVYNNLRDPKFEAIVDRWLLFRGRQRGKDLNWDSKMEDAVGRYLLFGSG